MSPILDLPQIENTLNHIFQLTYSLYWKTHSAHWNIVSPDFYPLHELFESQYSDLWKSLDGIAERFRSLGLSAPTTVGMQSAPAFGSSRTEYLSTLIIAHIEIITALNVGIETLEAAGDSVGADFLTERLSEHQKMHWMLSASK